MASLVDQHGPFLRVEEAAQLLRISRTSAYALANRWLVTDGIDGLPAIRIGRSIRIPTVAIESLAGLGPALSPPHLGVVDAG
jgi:excisionase family DNA binding protein